MVLEPPAAYLNIEPGPVQIIELSATFVELNCAAWGKAHAQACSIHPIAPGGTCTIYVPIIGRGGVGAMTRAALDRHERAHCNGWVH